jgi:ribokinase
VTPAEVGVGGALVVALLAGREQINALGWACAAGALAAARPGAQPSLPTAAEVDAVLAA